MRSAQHSCDMDVAHISAMIESQSSMAKKFEERREVLYDCVTYGSHDGMPWIELAGLRLGIFSRSGILGTQNVDFRVSFLGSMVAKCDQCCSRSGPNRFSIARRAELSRVLGCMQMILRSWLLDGLELGAAVVGLFVSLLNRIPCATV